MANLRMKGVFYASPTNCNIEERDFVEIEKENTISQFIYVQLRSISFEAEDCGGVAFNLYFGHVFIRVQISHG